MMGVRDVRPWHAFQLSIVLVFLFLLGMMATAGIMRLQHGELTTAEAEGLLGVLYWGTYPLLFVALGALAWHMVRFYRGSDA